MATINQDGKLDALRTPKIVKGIHGARMVRPVKTSSPTSRLFRQRERKIGAFDGGGSAQINRRVWNIDHAGGNFAASASVNLFCQAGRKTPLAGQ